MTFSIVARSDDGESWGVAVASKFLAVGSAVPAAAAQAYPLALSQRVKGQTAQARAVTDRCGDERPPAATEFQCCRGHRTTPFR